MKHLSTVLRGSGNDMYGDRDDLELQRLLRDAVERRREIVENKHARVCFEERLARDFFCGSVR